MNRARSIALLAAGLAASATAQQPVFRSSVDSVVVDVSVLAKNRPVIGLSAGDFEILDNGEPHPIVDVSYESLPIDLTLVVDASGSVTGFLLQSLRRALTDIGGSLRAGDRARIVTFNQRVKEVMPLTGTESLNLSRATMSPRGQTSLFDALAFSLVMAPAPGRRQMAILFTDGKDTISLTDEAAVVDVARRSEPAVFVVAMTQGSPRFPIAPAHERLFRTLTEATGGRLFVLMRGETVSPSFLQAVADFRSSYVIRYTLRSDRRQGWHDIQVRVTRPGQYDVRARKGYFGG